jgi:aryl-alcohol dehydrogenase-like predicted oxidoreductase
MKLLNGVGLGTFPFANPFSFIEENEAEQIIRRYMDLGGVYFDVAPTYSYGAVEELLGKTLSQLPRDSYFVNSFCGYVLEKGSNTFVKSGKYSDVIADCNQSLKRLKLDYLDLYTNHIPDPATPFAETIGAMEDLRREGKIKRIGVSNVTLEQLREYNSSGSVSFVEMRFSLINQYFTPEFLHYCSDHRIGIIAYQVIERGLLTNKVTQGLTLREGDLRHTKPEFKEEFVRTIGQWVEEEIVPIANSLRLSVATLMIWWATQQPGIAMCQAGATKLNHVDDIMAAATLRPSEHTVGRINAAYDKLEKTVKETRGHSVREFMGLANNMYQNLSATGNTETKS